MTDARPAEGRERLLRAAIRHLEAHGEARLRVTEIAAEADVAIGLIRHHFGSRDGLVAEAQQVRVAGAAREDLVAIRDAVESATSYQALRERYEGLVRRLFATGRAQIRLSRLAAISTAHGRPEAHEHIGRTIGELLDEFAESLDLAKTRGLVRSDLDARATATFIQAYALGMTLADLDPTPVEVDALVGVIMRVLDLLLAPEA